ncbi:MAG TPA: PRC-barrel domain-containing protein [Devosia sp.]|nr:PRC-barrel domain-containing protein [Devosia sp.]
MDHSNHVHLNEADLTPAMLEGATIYDAEDHKVGTVSHVHGIGAASQIVVDVGGFLGMGSKPVSVPASQLDFMRDEKGDVHAVTHWTKKELEDLPEHKDLH